MCRPTPTSPRRQPREGSPAQARAGYETKSQSSRKKEACLFHAGVSRWVHPSWQKTHQPRSAGNSMAIGCPVWAGRAIHPLGVARDHRTRPQTSRPARGRGASRRVPRCPAARPPLFRQTNPCRRCQTVHLSRLHDAIRLRSTLVLRGAS